MTLFVNRLTQLDVSLWCPKRGIIGASWHDDVEFDGELGEDGMLFDFGEEDAKETVSCRYRTPQGRFFLRLPKERCAVLPTPTAVEHIATWLASSIARETGASIRVQAFEGVDKGAFAEARP